MSASSWTNEHERLLADARPITSEMSDAEFERVWTTIAVEVARNPKPRRVPLRMVVGAAVGAAVLGTTTVAVAQFHSAHTGKGPVDIEDLRLGGPGERLDPAAPDYGRVVTQETQDIPFPSAAFRSLAVQNQVDDARGAKPGEEGVSVGAIRAWMADSAVCTWSNQWASATRSGDSAGQAEAALMIRQAATWPAVVAVDPAPYSRQKSLRVTDETGTVRTKHLRDESPFYYLAALGRAVDRHQVTSVAALLAKNNGYCNANLVPDLPSASALTTEP